MLCCLDAGVTSDDEYAARKKASKRSKKKKTFKEVQLSVDDAYKHMNGKIPANEEESNHSGDTELEEAKAEHEKNMTHFEMDVLKQQVHQLQRERDDYQTRLSRYASSSLNEANPNIVDLSDPNRPDALAQRVAELYDNQWTDAYIYLTDMGMTEKTGIGILTENFRIVYRVCKTLATQQMSSMGAQIGFFTGFDHIPDHFMMHVKMYKDERKKNYQNFLPVLEKKARKYVKTVKGLGDYFLLEALEICWLMCIQDPPMALDFACYPGDVFDTKTFRPFTNTGSHVDFLVWPGLRLYENGPLLCKGFAQGRKGIPNTSQRVTRRLTEHQKAEPKGEHGSMYRRRDNSAHLSRISESSQEGQTSFLSSEISKSNSGRSSNRFYSNYDSQSLMSRSSSMQDINRRTKEYERFLKNADFKTGYETDSYTDNEHYDSEVEERFVIPGRYDNYNLESAEVETNYTVVTTEQNETHIHTKSKHETVTIDNELTVSKHEEKLSNLSDPAGQSRTSDVTMPTQTETHNAAMQLQSKSPHKQKTPNIQGEEQAPWQDFFDEKTEIHNNAIEVEKHSTSTNAEFVHSPQIHTKDERDRDIESELTVTPSFTSASRTPLVTESPAQGEVSNIKKRRAIHFSPGSSPTKANSRGSSQANLNPGYQANIDTAVHALGTGTPSGSLVSKSSLKNKNKTLTENTTNDNQVHSQSVSSNERLRKQISPVPSPVVFLTVKTHKIKRMPKRRHLEEEEDVNDASENKSGHQGKQSSKTTNMSLDYTPRNVPSVESIALKSIDTSRQSRNTSRHTNVTATPRQSRRSDMNTTERSSKQSVEKSKHTHQRDRSKESPGRAVVDSHHFSEHVVSFYSPRKKHTEHTIPVIKQYPAIKPDFTNTIKMRPDHFGHGAFLLNPKPAPKIPGTVAAKLRFAIN